jgi:hypothetical protein
VIAPADHGNIFGATYLVQGLYRSDKYQGFDSRQELFAEVSSIIIVN